MAAVWQAATLRVSSRLRASAQEGNNMCGYEETDEENILCKGWSTELLDMAIDLHGNRHGR